MAVMTATLISVLDTPGAVTGRFFVRSAALKLVVGPLAGGAVESDVLDEPAFPQAATTRTIAIPAIELRARIASPRTTSSTKTDANVIHPGPQEPGVTTEETALGYTLVTFHAHPDDESIATAGTMARAKAEGHRVVLVLATRGELGEYAPDALAPDETLTERRVAELHAAAEVLGVDRVEFLGYHDSGMAGESTPSSTSPSSPFVATTSTTRCPSAFDFAITPPVAIASSSGWA